MPKRILFLATYFPDPNHPSRGNWALEHARAFVEAGVEVCVVVPTSWIPGWAGALHPKLKEHASVPAQLEMEGFTVHYVRWPYYPWQVFRKFNGRFPSALLRLALAFMGGRLNALVRAFQPDAVCAYHTLVCGQIAHWLHRRHGLPYVVSDQEVGDYLSCEHHAGIRKVFLRVGGPARKMVACSETMAKAGRKALPELSFAVIHNGSSTPVYERAREDAATADAADAATADRPVRVLCCAKFYGRKDIPLLLRAFDAVCAKGHRAELWLGGDGPDRAKIDTLHRELAHRDKIRFLGLLTPEAVLEQMRAADIFALVGWAEPFGVVFLEAMACGLPVVVASDAGVAEVLTHGQTAMITKPRDQQSVEDALTQLIADPHLRQRIGRAGQQLYAADLTWQRQVQRYLDLLA